MVMLAGCMDIPQPFRHQGTGSDLARPDFSAADQNSVTDAARRPTAQVAEIAGLPTGGNEALRRAIRGALERRGLLVVGQGGDAVIQPRVRVLDGTQLAVNWAVTSPDGVQWGQVSQQGEMTSAAKQGDWGQLTHDIAEGAAEGIVKIIQTTFTNGHGD